MDREEIRRLIGRRIASARKSNNLTIDKFAELMDTSPSMVWKWSTGHTGASLYKLFDIAKVLGVDPAYFITNISNERGIEKSELINTIELLSEDECRKLLPYVKSILDIIKQPE